METTTTAAPPVTIDFETHPDRYVHWKLSIDGALATLAMDVQEERGLRPGYPLKMNSYDLGVDIELADAIERLRFEHPAVKVVVVRSAHAQVFCSGANIYMLGSSTHAFKVNFCKFTNETRCGIEDASKHSGIRFVAALNGTCAGGGYELAMACDEIHLVDDGNSAVSLPEVPLLGVLPGTGGLTRLVDKRKVRRDLADVFSTTAEGVRGRRAVEWGLVDAVHPKSKFEEKLRARVAELTKDAQPSAEPGVTLPPLEVEVAPDRRAYRYVTLEIDRPARVARLLLRAPAELVDERSANFWPLRLFREFDDALLHLRFNEPGIGCVVVRSEGSIDTVLAADRLLLERKGDRFFDEVRLKIARVLRRVDLSAKSFFTLVEPGSCFAGSLLEVALASDRIYVREDEATAVAASAMNRELPMPNGATRLATRFLAAPAKAEAVLARAGEKLSPDEIKDLGLATFVLDDLDWDDDVRIAIEERASLSPDALTGMEANLRFAGAESSDSKIYGRLTAWQNWIFIRPNATGERGALTMYGKPERPIFDFNRV